MADRSIATEPEKLRLISVIIPARDEEGCIASTVEHLHLELDLRGVPHEIIVIDDGSKDRTWQILQEEAQRLNASGSVTQVSNSGLVAAATHLRPPASGSALILPFIHSLKFG